MSLATKVDVLDLVTYMNMTPMIEWCVFRSGFKNGYKKMNVFKRDWTTCSERDNKFKLNN
jgi:hypothetical protein